MFEDNKKQESSSLEDCLSKVSNNNQVEISECFFRFTRDNTVNSKKSEASLSHLKDAYMTCDNGMSSSNCNRKNLFDRFIGMSYSLFHSKVNTKKFKETKFKKQTQQNNNNKE